MTDMTIQQDENSLVTIGRRAGYAVRDLSKELMSPVRDVNTPTIYTKPGADKARLGPDYSKRLFLGVSLVLAGLVAEEYFIGIGKKLLFPPSRTISKSITPTSEATYSMSSGSTSEVISQVQTSQTATIRSLPPLNLGLNDLGGYSFHDYNGNGGLGEDEPLVNDIDVIAESRSKKFTVKSEDALYVFKDLPHDSYKVYPVHPQNKFRYMWRSGEEVVDTKKGYQIQFGGKLRLDMAMGEGLETFPFVETNFNISSFVDIGDVENPSNSVVRDWSGGKQTYKGHQGIDYVANEGMSVVAAAPGIVIGAEDDWLSNPDLSEIGNRIVIDHLNGFRTAYNHLSKIKVQKRKLDLYTSDISTLQKVRRGEVIGSVGHTGQTPFSHLHFEAWPPSFRYFGGGKGWVIDHYRDLFFGEHGRALFSNKISLWTKDNDPKTI